jgi:hypothetical protein
MSMQKGNLSYDSDERRKAGRMRCALTNCQYGQVTNMSKTGCRIMSKKAIALPPGATVNLEIKSACMEVTVTARPVSCRVRPDGKYDVGCQFVNLTEDLARKIIQLARTALDTSEAKPGKVA